jgi:hypothetical protein
MGWYGPTMTSLYDAVAEYHRVKRKPVPNATELAKFIGKSLQFTVGPTGEEKTFTVSWTKIEISPNGWDRRYPQYYVYKTNVYGVTDTMGVEGLTAPKAKKRAPLPVKKGPASIGAR